LRLRVGDHRAHEALRWVGGEDVEGLVFAPARGLADWDAAEDELAEAFRLSREATLADAPVVYLLDMDAVLGRADPLDSAVATGLVAGARSLAFEGKRYERYAAVVAADEDVTPEAIAEAVGYALSSRSALGQVLSLGSAHVGALMP
jgi:hypothetical protein